MHFQVVNLIPNGNQIQVNDQNKIQYLNALAQYKLSVCSKAAIGAFLKGLNELIPDELLSIFDENELEVSIRVINGILLGFVVIIYFNIT